MVDPLVDVITLLRPRAVFSKVISGAGAWAVRYSAFGQPSFCTMLEGRCLLTVDQQAPLTLEAGDFLLMPATPGFTLSSPEPAVPVFLDPDQTRDTTGELRHGRRSGPPDVRMLGGYFAFDSPDAALLVSLLPVLMQVRGVERLPVLVQLVRDESLDTRPGRDLVLRRLVEILLVEALRSGSGSGSDSASGASTQGDGHERREGDAPPGLLRGLADARVAVGLRLMHGEPTRAWTVEALARQAALSRSTFFERFSRTVGLPPMEYLLSWRMALAKDLLARGDLAIADVAERVGYGSASTFSTAFSRYVGVPPGRYAREREAAGMEG
ncbi:AraC family transcriptional regulator [Hylemonella gracilis]|uniref:AraC family transcriptional regulator n=1 Tax=Hylemonella gracilis TaxID=80880 RepID=A0A4P6UJ56_9BURK|nr:AraC family transcriptional regulator [Hylemonella gracilis]QBK04566.1 AraC family transcriptional regulator [Hylemonella gracilis]